MADITDNFSPAIDRLAPGGLEGFGLGSPRGPRESNGGPRGDRGGRTLDVNNFDAIRITLASPEAIRGWSYGEVTKPETINYRTLKPEHGGLFCERIFGPTKDWECYCGKYKRIRHAGTVCDKCGVEVTRAKVRRERMAHIELAAPVAHIWYVKGTPSRLGLLLDITPRNLERVLYFASYLVTDVNEEARQAAIADLTTIAEEEIAEVRAELEAQANALSEGAGDVLANLGEGASSTKEIADAARKKTLASLKREYNKVTKALEAQKGSAAEKAITFRGTVIVEASEAINDDRIEALTTAYQVLADQAETDYQDEVSGVRALAGGETDLVAHETDRQLREIENSLLERIREVETERDEALKAINDIVELQILSETQYRELQELVPPGVFKAGMGAEAVHDYVKNKIDLDQIALELRTEMQDKSEVKRKKAAKRLRVVDALRKSGNQPHWMIFTALPVIPPELRPMVQLDGGRFATSDLNDLYRRVINRNNRLKRLLELGAPDIIVRNEKRMLQEAVDALIDNGRRGRVVSGSGKHKLKSLSDMLKGKQGRFRQNLLGKRVDYSGRSVIVVGPDLDLDECGLPKRMALELFKPFVMRRLVDHGYAHNIKAAKRLVERVDSKVWDVLEEVIQDYLVLLNRAPTLHRLGIQAFRVRLIEGSAIQLHPMVCPAFNADFDGDQMAVHVPLSRKAQEEARTRMLSIRNLLSPSNGEPIVSPTQDIVLGCYYMTMRRSFKLNFEDQSVARGTGKIYSSLEEVKLAYDAGAVDLHAEIAVLTDREGGVPRRIETTVGRVLFNLVLPEELGRFYNDTMGKSQLQAVVADCYRQFKDPFKTAKVVNDIKGVGFAFSTRGGLSLAMEELGGDPEEKKRIVGEATKATEKLNRNHRRGLLTDNERLSALEEIWSKARLELQQAVGIYMSNQGDLGSLGVLPQGEADGQNGLVSTMPGMVGISNAVYIMTHSGAKGNMNQIGQMAGMRGLVLNTQNQVINHPIIRSYRDGLTSLEFFLGSHGARKGLADTAMRTADSGYLTRRLVDVSQDVIVTLVDCGTDEGTLVEIPHADDPRHNDRKRHDFVPFDDAWDIFQRRVVGRFLVNDIVSEDGEIVASRNKMVVDGSIGEIEENQVGLDQVLRSVNGMVPIRTVMTCEATVGVCQTCYGRSLATNELVELGDAVGVIAAQSIGEPGTQLTMRTFRSGGIAGDTSLIGQRAIVSDAAMRARIAHRERLIKIIDGLIGALDRRDEQVTMIDDLKVVAEAPSAKRLSGEAAAGQSVTETARFGQMLATFTAIESEIRDMEPVAGYERIRAQFSEASDAFTSAAQPNLEDMIAQFGSLATVREYGQLVHERDRLEERLVEERAEIAAITEAYDRKLKPGSRRPASDRTVADRSVHDRRVENYRALPVTEIRRERDRRTAEVQTIEKSLSELGGRIANLAGQPLVVADLRARAVRDEIGQVGQFVEFGNFDRTRKWLDSLDLTLVTAGVESGRGALGNSSEDAEDDAREREMTSLEQISLAEAGVRQALAAYQSALKGWSKEISAIRHMEEIQQWETLLASHKRIEDEFRQFTASRSDYRRESEAYEDTQKDLVDQRAEYLEVKAQHHAFLANSAAALEKTAAPAADTEGGKTKSTAKTIQVRRELTGLPRVEEIFEARNPGRPAILADREGVVSVQDTDIGRLLAITSNETDQRVYRLETGWEPAVVTGAYAVKDKTVLAVGRDDEKLLAEIDGEVVIDGRTLYVRNEKNDRVEHLVPLVYEILVEDGAQVRPGQQLTDGTKDPQQILLTQGLDAVQRYIIDEVRKMYRSGGVNTDDKHIEVICRQMLRKVSITYPGDTDYLQDERIDRFEFNEINEEILAQGGEPATGIPVLLGITKASLETDSFLSAASFQETTRVLTEAAINGKVDSLRGLKENVIIGKLIPAGSGFGVTPTIELPLHEELALAAMAEKADPATEEDIASLMEGGFLPATAVLDQPLGGEEILGEGDDPLSAILGAATEAPKARRTSRSKEKSEQTLDVDDFGANDEG